MHFFVSIDNLSQILLHEILFKSPQREKETQNFWIQFLKLNFHSLQIKFNDWSITSTIFYQVSTSKNNWIWKVKRVYSGECSVVKTDEAAAIAGWRCSPEARILWLIQNSR